MAKTPTHIASLARSHTETALKVLAGIMMEPDAPHAARVAAIKELLDRGWGKAAQVLTDGEGGAPVIHIVTGVPRND